MLTVRAFVFLVDFIFNFVRTDQWGQWTPDGLFLSQLTVKSEMPDLPISRIHPEYSLSTLLGHTLDTGINQNT